MGIRFRKSIKVAPGVKVNINKSSVGVTAGIRGAHHTINSKGKSTTSVGIPGTGLSYVKTSGGGKSQKKAVPVDTESADYTTRLNGAPIEENPDDFSEHNETEKSQKPIGSGWLIFWLIIFFPVGLYLMWRRGKWPSPVKWIISAIFAIALISNIATGNSSDPAPDTAIVQEANTETETTEAPSEFSTEAVSSTADITQPSTSQETEAVPSEPVSSASETAATPTPTKTTVSIQTTAASVVSETAAPQSETVYITKSGAKYHKSWCSSLKKGKIEISLKDAQSRGYQPCKRCF